MEQERQKIRSFTLTTARGRQIRTTAHHPYLAKYGWVKVAFLNVGDEPVVPRETPHSLFGVKNMLVVIPAGHKTCRGEYQRNDCLYDVSIHNSVLAAGHDEPDHNDQGYGAGCDVEGKKIHRGALMMGIFSFLSSVILARARKEIVSTMPMMNVMMGNSGVAALGMKTPITSDPKIIFDPSRKKLDTVSDWIRECIRVWYQAYKNNVKSRCGHYTVRRRDCSKTKMMAPLFSAMTNPFAQCRESVADQSKAGAEFPAEMSGWRVQFSRVFLKAYGYYREVRVYVSNEVEGLRMIEEMGEVLLSPAVAAAPAKPVVRVLQE